MNDSLHAFAVETQRLIALAPRVPDDDEVARVAARARTLATPSRAYRRFAAVGVVVVVATAAVAVGLLAGHAPVPQPVTVQPPIAHPAYLGNDNAPSVPRHLFTKDNFGRLTPADLEKKYSIHLAFPATAATGTYEGIFDSGEVYPDDTPVYYAVYSNDIVIGLTILPTAKEAVRWVQDEMQGDFGLYATNIDLNGVEAYAMPRLNVPPQPGPIFEEWDPSSGPTPHRVLPGTGIATGTAKVFWHVGRIVVSVMNPDASIDTLTAVARGVILEPDATAK